MAVGWAIKVVSNMVEYNVYTVKKNPVVSWRHIEQEVFDLYLSITIMLVVWTILLAQSITVSADSGSAHGVWREAE